MSHLITLHDVLQETFLCSKLRCFSLFGLTVLEAQKLASAVWFSSLGCPLEFFLSKTIFIYLVVLALVAGSSLCYVGPFVTEYRLSGSGVGLAAVAHRLWSSRAQLSCLRHEIFVPDQKLNSLPRIGRQILTLNHQEVPQNHLFFSSFYGSAIAESE